MTVESFIVIVKKMLGIKDFSLLKKNIHKNIGKLIYHKRYTSDDLIFIMERMGMKKGSLVCIHSSMKEFYNYDGTVEELISKILESIGSEGTLMMPAFPDYSLLKEGYIFDLESDRTGAGYLAETFRKYPEVQRSINVLHSVCAIGPLAEYLLKDHHKGTDCWDTMSPWYRLCENDGLIFNLGMPRNYIGTFEHCVESILKYEHPYWAQFFTRKETFYYYDANRNICSYVGFMSEIPRRTCEMRIFKWFSDLDWRISRISNLEIKVFYSKHCLDKMLNLGRIGVSLYWKPSTKKFKF